MVESDSPALNSPLRSLVEREKWTRKDQSEVAVRDLASSAIEIEISVYFEVTTRHEEVEARESLLLGCLRLAEELQIELAFPTQTLHLVADGESAALPLLGHARSAGEPLHKASA